MPSRSAVLRTSRNARFVLAAALGLVLLSVAQISYRFSLPTDGWSVYTAELDQPDWLLYHNLVGASSLLQENDALLAVDGHPISGTASLGMVSRPTNWIPGRDVIMTVLRNGRQLDITVPVVLWTFLAWWRGNVLDLSSLVDFLGALILFATALFAFVRRPEVPSA